MATAFQVWVQNGEFPRHLFQPRDHLGLTRLVYDPMSAALSAEGRYGASWVSVCNGVEFMTRAEFLELYCTELESPGTPCQCNSCVAKREEWTLDEIMAREG